MFSYIQLSLRKALVNMQPQRYTPVEQTQTNTPQQQPLLLSTTTQQLAPSATLSMNEAVAQRRAAGRKTIHLGFGEATFPLHPLLQSALADAANHTSYSAVAGLPALRQAIADYLSRQRGLTYTANDIIVGPGSKPLLYALLHVLQGDLLLPVPSWVSYAPQARLARKRVIHVPTDPSDCQHLTTQSLSTALATARSQGADPRILIVNSPSNPTGSMFGIADVEALATWARDEGITIISDEIYAELAHGWRPHISPAHFYPEGCIVTGGLSKAFSAGGWRIGYAAMPPTEAGRRVTTALRVLASEIWSATATPLQEAAVVAFSSNPELGTYVQRSAHVHAYVTNQLYTTLTSLGIPCPRPAGAFYLYPDFAPLRSALKTKGVNTSSELAHYLLNEWDIATLPGVVFGEEPEALRLRLATSMLYTPTGTSTPEEREATLWQLLAQSDILPSENQPPSQTISLPALSQTQATFTKLIAYLSGL